MDGKEVWTQLVGGGQPPKAKYDIVVPVKAGSLVDFAVDPGPGTSMDYDATSVSITITHLP